MVSQAICLLLWLKRCLTCCLSPLIREGFIATEGQCGCVCVSVLQCIVHVHDSLYDLFMNAWKKFMCQDFIHYQYVYLFL